MSLTTAFPLPSTSQDETAGIGSLLVCATGSSSAEPVVVLANGTYETGTERVFWRADREDEVLRLPLAVPVSIRPVRRGIPAPRGELALLAAVAAARPAPSHERPEQQEESGDLREQLCLALREGALGRALPLATLLSQRAGLASCYRAVRDCLAELGSAWERGEATVLAEHRASRTARSLCELLGSTTPPVSSAGTVLLTVPPGERHTLGLAALSHLLRAAGWSVEVVDDLPLDELVAAAASPGTSAVLLSAHVTFPAARARKLLSALHEAAPHVLLVAGGPGMPRTGCGAHLVTDDPDRLLQALREHSSVLTVREREVLLSIADGLTNAEIAGRLGVAPATVKTHLDHIFVKTRTEHRAAAVAHALRQDWIR